LWPTLSLLQSPKRLATPIPTVAAAQQFSSVQLESRAPFHFQSTIRSIPPVRILLTSPGHALTDLSNADVEFSVSQIYNPDDGQYEVVTLYGIDGSVTTVQPGQTVAVGPPQVQTSAFCEIVCPSL